MTAIENVLRNSENLTPDMGGSADTEGLGKAIAASI
jgi:isocitrate/isopropylmalate dehydrogenase